MNAQTLIKEQNELDEEFIRPSKYSTQERVLKVLELKSKAFGYAEGLDKIDRVICPVKFTKTGRALSVPFCGDWIVIVILALMKGGGRGLAFAFLKYAPAATIESNNSSMSVNANAVLFTISTN